MGKMLRPNMGKIQADFMVREVGAALPSQKMGGLILALFGL